MSKGCCLLRVLTTVERLSGELLLDDDHEYDLLLGDQSNRDLGDRQDNLSGDLDALLVDIDRVDDPDVDLEYLKYLDFLDNHLDIEDDLERD
jgi:hypothetical protein